MSFADSFRLTGSRNARVVYVSIALVLVASAISSFARKPRTWPIAEVPVAFWA